MERSENELTFVRFRGAKDDSLNRTVKFSIAVLAFSSANVALYLWRDQLLLRLRRPRNSDSMNDSPNRDVEVFTEALRLPLAERAAYLDGACGNDAKRRRQVEAPLEANASVGDFLQNLRPISRQAWAPLPAGEKPGDCIGP